MAASYESVEDLPGCLLWVEYLSDSALTACELGL